MDTRDSTSSSSNKAPGLKRAREFGALSRKLLSSANRGLSRTTFFKSALQALRDYSACDVIELWSIDQGGEYYCRFDPSEARAFRQRIIAKRRTYDRPVGTLSEISNDFERLCHLVIDGRIDPSFAGRTPRGSLILITDGRLCRVPLLASDSDIDFAISPDTGFASIAIVPFTFEKDNRGALIFNSRDRVCGKGEEVEFLEELAGVLGIAVAHWGVQIALRERVKELTCLCGMTRAAAKPDISLPEFLKNTVHLLPIAWQYPDIATARIVFDNVIYATDGFREGLQSISADIYVHRINRGKVEVAYTRKVRDHDEGPFLKEERTLIDVLAGEISLIIERKEAEEHKDRLEGQLRHADRLATIGQLAAGVAHELNEPLGSILGFAQLAAKDSDIPEPVGKDIDRIVKAALHARTVIERLNLFARQAPQNKGPVNLNAVVREGLYFLESRCVKAGIAMEKVLDPNMPDIMADSGQIYQVLVNLVVNAIQAMPDGGKLTIRTSSDSAFVRMTVEDTGMGMTDTVKSKIFLPFFTTKDINEGTGLGLAVVHGIVTAHEGKIEVASSEGAGTCFEVHLPRSQMRG